MEFTGERIIPKIKRGNIEEHVLLYQESLKYVENKFVLDIACGVGWGTELLATKSKCVIGVDIDSQAIEYAKKEYVGDNFTFCSGSILKIPFPENNFDVVNSIETFEHVKRFEIETLISECHRVLKPEGLFIFSTPDFDQFPYQPKTEKEYRGFHFWHYKKEELFELLQPFFKEVAVEKPQGAGFHAVCKK